MTDVLSTILETKKREVAVAKEVTPLAELQQQIARLPRCRNFYQALTQPNPRGINVIAEIKRASPSAGLIRPDFDPVRLAQTYLACGADALSILTDETYFQGRLEYLHQVKQAVPLPILRKDFIIEAYQVYQSRAAGADAILLIAEALSPADLMDLLILAQSLTLSVLLEVHELDSLLRIRSLLGFPQARYSLLGINNRNLKTLEVDLNTSLRLAEFIDDKRELVAESGIQTRSDVERLMRSGFNSILIGETLMRSADIPAKFRQLFNPPAP